MKKLLYKLCLINLFVIFYFNVVAQDNYADSLKKVLLTQKEDTNKVNTLNELSSWVADNGDSALQYARQALILSQKLYFKNGEGNAYYNYGVALKGSNYKGEQGTLSEVLDYLNKAISVFKTIGNQRKIADCYFHISLAYYSIDQNLPEAIKNILSALRIYEKISDKYQIATCYLWLGEEYGSDEKTVEEGMNSLKSALQIFKKIKDSAQIAYTAHVIGDTHLDYGRDQEALKYYDTCLTVYKAMGSRGPDFGISWAQGGVGDVYMSQGSEAIQTGDFRKASEKLQAALKIFKERLAEETTGKMSHRQSYPELGDCYWYLSKICSGNEKKINLLQSKKYYELALQVAIKSNHKGLLSNSYYNLSEISSAFKDYKQAYEYYKNFITYRDSLHNEENTKKTVQAQMQYEFDKKEAVAKAEQDKKDADAKRTKNQQFFTIVALGIVVLAVVIIAVIQFRNNKHKQKANIVIAATKKKK